MFLQIEKRVLRKLALLFKVDVHVRDSVVQEGVEVAGVSAEQAVVEENQVQVRSTTVNVHQLEYIRVICLVIQLKICQKQLYLIVIIEMRNSFTDVRK